MNTNEKKSARLSDDSINYRCSSLQVNLSCTSDLTDSGNESLKHTDVECHDNPTVSKVKCIACLHSNESRCSNKKRTFLDHTCVSYVPLKNASVILKRINHDDAILNKSCESLKTAILIKTKQMFEGQNELSVKTCKILTSKDVRLSSSSAENIMHTSEDNVCTISDNMNNVKSLNERANMTRIIGDISTDKCINEERGKQKRHDRYKKKHLFLTKDESNNKNINDNSINSKLSILKSNNECHGNNHTTTRITENSCTMNASLNTLYKLVSSSRIGNCGSDNFIASGDRSISTLNISKDEDTFMATPIACSTMINENDEISGTEHKTQLLVKNNLPSIPNTHAKRNITSMEITDVCEGFILCDKSHSFMERVKKGTSANCPRRGSKATIIDRDAEQNTNMQYIDASIERESANTEKTSLNVNTSIDLINRSDNGMDKHERKCKEKIYSKFRNKHNEDAGSSFSKKTEESINTVCTSLQMNTSLNILETVQENDRRNEISGSIDTENETRDANENNNTDISNIYKTNDRNSFKSPENCFNDEKINIEQKDKVNSAIATDRYEQVVNKIRSNEPSYIEATPYPMYRSVMLKSQLRQNAESCSFHNNGKSKVHNSSNMYFKNQDEMKDNTIISNNLSHKRYSTKSRAGVVVPLTNENELEEDANLEKVDKKRCKKRLMPLNEHSQVSLSPVEKQYSPPRCLTFRKRLLKRKNKGNKIDTNGIRHDEVDEEKTCNEKKNQGKKAKKIVSKKIVVKKIVNQEILKKLEENRENFNKSRIDMHGSNINSSNDFQSLRGSSTTRCRKKKTFRISIVTTGLSNDDKGIVKSVVKALGFARIESNVTKRTTHVVTTGVRTINLLHGIIRGCWIVGLEWILKSLENDVWLNPQEYEMMHFSNAVLENRKDRQLFGSSYVPELFAACGYIHIENNTMPPCNVLKDLVKTAGGCITENPEIAKVIIGTEGLKETWVFDCITSGELQPYNHYVRT